MESTQSNITLRGGDIFLSRVQAIVNPVNCVGVMGKGLALSFKQKFPDMFQWYRRLCSTHSLLPGEIATYSDKGSGKHIICFATKDHWANSSRLEWVKKGLDSFVAHYKTLGITSAAFPMLGTGCGGLDHDKVLSLMTETLSKCDIPIEIYIGR